VWTYKPQKRQDGSAFALASILRRRSCRLMGVFVIAPAFHGVEGVTNRSRPALHGHSPASPLLQTPPSPSRLRLMSRGTGYTTFLASAACAAGRGGSRQVLRVSLSPGCGSPVPAEGQQGRLCPLRQHRSCLLPRVLLLPPAVSSLTGSHSRQG